MIITSQSTKDSIPNCLTDKDQLQLLLMLVMTIMISIYNTMHNSKSSYVQTQVEKIELNKISYLYVTKLNELDNILSDITKSDIKIIIDKNNFFVVSTYIKLAIPIVKKSYNLGLCNKSYTIYYTDTSVDATNIDAVIKCTNYSSHINNNITYCIIE
jgi:hypothetical protein